MQEKYLNDAPDKNENLAELSDEQLLLMHRKGQKGAFEALVRRRGDELYRFLYRFCPTRALADDVFQETFLQVHKSASSFDISRKFKPWLFTIAANKARDAMRSLKRKKATSLDAVSIDEDRKGYIDILEANINVPLEELENQELRETVRDIVQQMPENLKEVLLLTYFQQMPYKDVAEALDIPLGTVKSRLHTAVKHFAAKWQAIEKKFSDQ